MTSRFSCAWFALVVATTPLLAQQTGTIIGGPSPGSAIGRHLTAVEVLRPRPTCDSAPAPSGIPALPEMVYARAMDYLVCLRHADGRSEKLLNGGPWMALSSEGNDLVYWLPDKHELHVFSIADRTDKVVDTSSGTTMDKMSWSGKGRILMYTVRGASPSGAHVIDLDSGTRQTLAAVSRVVASGPDSELILTIDRDGVERVNFADGRRELVAAVKNADSAEYSRSGLMLGILASTINEASASADDNEPDCTGGTFALYVQLTATKQLLDVPFPKGFDSVLDYEFSDDDRAVTVTFGAEACDYPGDVARVYLVSLPSLAMKPISPADRLSVKARWSPDSKMVIYSDYTGSNSPLMAVEVETGRSFRLTNPGEDGPDELLGWRTSQNNKLILTAEPSAWLWSSPHGWPAD